jgi:hypothetical protein
MQTLWQDLRWGVRMVMKNPGFTAVGVLTLAMAISANQRPLYSAQLRLLAHAFSG